MRIVPLKLGFGKINTNHSHQSNKQQNVYITEDTEAKLFQASHNSLNQLGGCKVHQKHPRMEHLPLIDTPKELFNSKWDPK